MTERKRFYWLDWMRFGAAFAVLVYHTCGNNWIPYGGFKDQPHRYLSWIFFEVTNTGIAPVVVFFVLSGFLVGGKVLERVANGTFDVQAYALDRISRIYMPLVPALLFTLVICLVCGNPISIGAFFGNIFGLQDLYCSPFGGNAPLWSLAYEFWFYLLAGYIGLLFASSYRLKGALFGVALIFVIFTRLDPALLFCWCLGAFAYSLHSKSFKPLWLFCSIALILLGYGLLRYVSDTANTNVFAPLYPSRGVAILILSLGLAALLPFLAQQAPRIKALAFVEQSGTNLAAFSYTLYLTHWPLLHLWHHFLYEKFTTFSLHAFLWFTVKLLSCIFVAWLLYLPFEAQTGRVRNWMRKRWTGRTIELYPIKQDSFS